MNGSKLGAVFAVLACAVAGCASQPKGHVVSTGPGIVVQETKPAGYPTTRIEKDDLGNCTRIEEDFTPGLAVQGNKTWNKVSKITSLGINCPA